MGQGIKRFHGQLMDQNPSKVWSGNKIKKNSNNRDTSKGEENESLSDSSSSADSHKSSSREEDSSEACFDGI